MAPLDAGSYADENPSAQHAELFQARTAAKRVAQGAQTQTFRPNAASEDLALRSEEWLSPGEKYRAERRRAQVTAGIGAPAAPPLVQPTKFGEEDDAPAPPSDYNDSWRALESESRQSEGVADPVLRARARSIQNQANAQSKSALEEAASNIVGDVWTSVFQGSGYVDAPCEDGSIMLHFGTAGTLYQTVLTLEVFPQLNQAVENNATASKLLPQKYNLKTIKGWGKLTSGVILLLTYSVAIVIIITIILIILSPFLATADLLGADMDIPPASTQTTTQPKE